MGFWIPIISTAFSLRINAVLSVEKFFEKLLPFAIVIPNVSKKSVSIVGKGSKHSSVVIFESSSQVPIGHA